VFVYVCVCVCARARVSVSVYVRMRVSLHVCGWVDGCRCVSFGYTCCCDMGCLALQVL
jgi:hypothetical protein